MMLNKTLQTSILFLFAIIIAGCSQKNFQYKPYQDQSALATKPSASFKYNLQPYSVNGKTYKPTFVDIGEEYSGVASWYGPDFHGKKTANGESYDMHAMTAAHKTLPINTIVKVVNKKNSKNVTVRINDRGPFVEGRIIDLSYAAGKQIGLDKTGTAPVVLTVLGFDGVIDKSHSQMPIELANFGVQIGAFKNKASADALAQNTNDGQYKAVVKTYDGDGKGLHRVILSGFNSLDEARDFAASGKYHGAFALSLD